MNQPPGTAARADHDSAGRGHVQEHSTLQGSAGPWALIWWSLYESLCSDQRNWTSAAESRYKYQVGKRSVVAAVGQLFSLHKATKLSAVLGWVVSGSLGCRL